MIKFSVNGTPKPKGSGFVVNPKGGGVFSPRDKATTSWTEAVRSETQRACEVPIPGPVRVALAFRLTRPKGHYRTGRNAHLLKDTASAYPESKPDIDKLVRSVLDGLKNGGAYWDDAQVVALAAVKGYALVAGVDVEITEEG